MTHQLPPNQKDNNPKINVESNYPAGHIGESFNKIEHIMNKINQLSSEELTILSKELSSNHNFELSTEQKFIELHGKQLIYHNSLAFYVLIGLGVAFAVPNLIAICLFLVTGNIYAATITTVSGGVSAVFAFG